MKFLTNSKKRLIINDKYPFTIKNINCSDDAIILVNKKIYNCNIKTLTIPLHNNISTIEIISSLVISYDVLY